MASHLVRIYLISDVGTSYFIIADRDEDYNEQSYLDRWQIAMPLAKPSVLLGHMAGVIRVYGAAIPGCNFRRMPRAGQSLSLHMYNAMQVAVTHMPPGAPYAVLFLDTEKWTSRQVTAARAIIDRQYEAANIGPLPLVETPLERWYNARKEFKAAEEALLEKLNAALVEKAKDPALNPGLAGNFQPATPEFLQAIAALTQSPVVCGSVVRFAACESVGFEFGPSIPVATYWFWNMTPRVVGSDDDYCTRRMLLPWCSDAQK